MNNDQIFERISKVKIPGLLTTQIKPARSDGKNVIVLEFWKISGAAKKDRQATITMAVDLEAIEGNLLFIAPNLENCDAKDLALTIYMDANGRSSYGQYGWNPENGSVSFKFLLPLPLGNDDFPNLALLKDILQSMYQTLMFREAKDFELAIAKDVLLSDDEKIEKVKRIHGVIATLTSQGADDDGSV